MNLNNMPPLFKAFLICELNVDTYLGQKNYPTQNSVNRVVFPVITHAFSGDMIPTTTEPCGNVSPTTRTKTSLEPMLAAGAFAVANQSLYSPSTQNDNDTTSSSPPQTTPTTLVQKTSLELSTEHNNVMTPTKLLSQLPENIAKIIYPDATIVNSGFSSSFEAVIEYTFSIQHQSELLHGFCRRFLHTDQDIAFPTVHCIITAHPYPRFWASILEITQVRATISPNALFAFLHALVHSQPQPLDSLTTSASPQSTSTGILGKSLFGGFSSSSATNTTANTNINSNNNNTKDKNGQISSIDPEISFGATRLDIKIDSYQTFQHCLQFVDQLYPTTASYFNDGDNNDENDDEGNDQNNKLCINPSYTHRAVKAGIINDYSFMDHVVSNSLPYELTPPQYTIPFTPPTFFPPFENSIFTNSLSTSLVTLLSHLSIDTLIQVFMALFYESPRILFVSTSIPILQLMQAVQGFQQLLQPFTWSYTFLPLLPHSMAPWLLQTQDPYILGINKETLDYVLQNSNNNQGNMPNEMVLIDLDGDRVVVRVGGVAFDAQESSFKLPSIIRDKIDRELRKIKQKLNSLISQYNKPSTNPTSNTSSKTQQSQQQQQQQQLSSPPTSSTSLPSSSSSSLTNTSASSSSVAINHTGGTNNNDNNSINDSNDNNINDNTIPTTINTSNITKNNSNNDNNDNDIDNDNNTTTNNKDITQNDRNTNAGTILLSSIPIQSLQELSLSLTTTFQSFFVVLFSIIQWDKLWLQEHLHVLTRPILTGELVLPTVDLKIVELIPLVHAMVNTRYFRTWILNRSPFRDRLNDPTRLLHPGPYTKRPPLDRASVELVDTKLWPQIASYTTTWKRLSNSFNTNAGIDQAPQQLKQQAYTLTMAFTANDSEPCIPPDQPHILLMGPDLGLCAAERYRVHKKKSIFHFVVDCDGFVPLVVPGMGNDDDDSNNTIQTIDSMRKSATLKPSIDAQKTNTKSTTTSTTKSTPAAAATTTTTKTTTTKSTSPKFTSTMQLLQERMHIATKVQPLITLSYDPRALLVIFSTLERRFEDRDSQRQWKHALHSLILLDILIQCGGEFVLTRLSKSMRSHIDEFVLYVHKEKNIETMVRNQALRVKEHLTTRWALTGTRLYQESIPQLFFRVFSPLVIPFLHQIHALPKYKPLQVVSPLDYIYPVPTLFVNELIIDLQRVFLSNQKKHFEAQLAAKNNTVVTKPPSGEAIWTELRTMYQKYSSLMGPSHEEDVSTNSQQTPFSFSSLFDITITRPTLLSKASSKQLGSNSNTAVQSFLSSKVQHFSLIPQFSFLTNLFDDDTGDFSLTPTPISQQYIDSVAGVNGYATRNCVSNLQPLFISQHPSLLSLPMDANNDDTFATSDNTKSDQMSSSSSLSSNIISPTQNTVDSIRDNNVDDDEKNNNDYNNLTNNDDDGDNNNIGDSSNFASNKPVIRFYVTKTHAADIVDGTYDSNFPPPQIDTKTTPVPVTPVKGANIAMKASAFGPPIPLGQLNNNNNTTTNNNNNKKGLNQKNLAITIPVTPNVPREGQSRFLIGTPLTSPNYKPFGKNDINQNIGDDGRVVQNNKNNQPNDSFSSPHLQQQQQSSSPSVILLDYASNKQLFDLLRQDVDITTYLDDFDDVVVDDDAINNDGNDNLNKNDDSKNDQDKSSSTTTNMTTPVKAIPTTPVKSGRIPTPSTPFRYPHKKAFHLPTPVIETKSDEIIYQTQIAPPFPGPAPLSLPAEQVLSYINFKLHGQCCPWQSPLVLTNESNPDTSQTTTKETKESQKGSKKDKADLKAKDNNENKDNSNNLIENDNLNDTIIIDPDDPQNSSSAQFQTIILRELNTDTTTNNTTAITTTATTTNNNEGYVVPITPTKTDFDNIEQNDDEIISFARNTLQSLQSIQQSSNKRSNSIMLSNSPVTGTLRSNQANIDDVIDENDNDSDDDDDDDDDDDGDVIDMIPPPPPPEEDFTMDDNTQTNQTTPLTLVDQLPLPDINHVPTRHSIVVETIDDWDFPQFTRDRSTANRSIQPHNRRTSLNNNSGNVMTSPGLQNIGKELDNNIAPIQEEHE